MKETEKILRLTLKKQWFDMIASGEKLEEYREIKPYWIRRFVFNHNSEESRNPVLEMAFELKNGEAVDLNEYFKTWNHAGLKRYEAVFAKNGYSKDAPTIQWQHKGIRIGTGKPEWGAEPGKQYFILEIGTVTRL